MPLPLPMDVRAQIISALIEGNSIRATARMTGANRGTVASFALRVGDGCARLHDRMVRGIAATLVECDELWSYVQKKQARVTEADPAEWGDAYTYLALDRTTRLIISWHVGKRDDAHTRAFIDDLRARLTVVPQLSTDGFIPYLDAVARAFRGAVDYGQVIKNYKGGGAARGAGDSFDKYEPPRDVFMTLTPVSGAPDMDLVSTSHIERLNGTMRHMVGRKRRRCLAFSKTLRGHRAAVALVVAAYNLVRVHETLGTTPAVIAGLAARPWTVGDLVAAALDEPETAAPRAVALAPQPGAGPARQTGTGRVLRLVHGGSVRQAEPAAPVTEPAAPEAPAGPVQLDLFSWRPKPAPPRPMVQLEMFPP